jgi:hypothetical protein
MSYQFGKRLSIAGRMFRGVAAILTVTGPLEFAVLHAMQAHSPLLHPTTTPPPSFEVATIKPSEEQKPGLRIQMDPANFVMAHLSKTLSNTHTLCGQTIKLWASRVG